MTKSLSLFDFYADFEKFQNCTPRVLIIGLGNIALGYNLDPACVDFRSHASSIFEFSGHLPQEVMLFGVDTDSRKIDAAISSKMFKKENLYSGIEKLPKIEFDLVLICTPIFTLSQVLHKVIVGLKFKKVLIEKPGAASFEEATYFNQEVCDPIKFAIGYPRRVLPMGLDIKEFLKSYVNYGWDVRIRYSGDTLNILSHFIDLTEFLLGELTINRVILNENLYSFEGVGSMNPDIAISIQQTDFSNNNDHCLDIIGPVDFHYNEANKTFNCSDLEFNSRFSQFLPFDYQLTNMIGFECLEYFDWLVSGKESNLSGHLSSGYCSLLKVLEDL